MSRTVARKALEAGWSQEQLVRIHRLGVDVRWVAAWGMVAGGYLVYRSYSPAFIERLAATPETSATVYCDGSGTSSDKAAGIGCVIYRGQEPPQFIAENIGLGTNNVAELRAVWRALQAIPRLDCDVLVRSDSEYAIGSLTKDWTSVANAELISSMRLDLSLRLRVRFEHVDGHAGHEGNEVADRLAKIGRKLVTTISCV